MYDGDLQPVWRCEHCSKPFNKPSTYKRHGYYCRTRKNAKDLPVRQRSCLSCAKSKLRCDNTQPTCSRCLAKGINCHYPSSKGVISSRDDSTTQEQDSARTDSVVASVDALADSFDFSDDVWNNASHFSDLNIIGVQEQSFDWPDPNISYQQNAAEAISNDIGVFLRHGPASITVDQPYTPLSPSLDYSPRKFIKRSDFSSTARRTANLMFHTLKSYPLMMIRDHTLPPFIHPSLVHSGEGDEDMEFLANSVTLVHMLSGGTRGSRKLFWRNVRQECQRICDEHLQLNAWQALAAMQAVSIYILIRLHEGETQDNDLDPLLVKTVYLVVEQFTALELYCDPDDQSSRHVRERNWKSWMYEESRRRLGVVYRVINMLMHCEVSRMCTLPADLVIAPLPAKKQLWEAGDESSWRLENDKDSNAQAAYALAANGDLLRLDEEQLSSIDDSTRDSHFANTFFEKRVANWEDWSSGMDGFGGLIMLT